MKNINLKIKGIMNSNKKYSFLAIIQIICHGSQINQMLNWLRNWKKILIRQNYLAFQWSLEIKCFILVFDVLFVRRNMAFRTFSCAVVRSRWCTFVIHFLKMLKRGYACVFVSISCKCSVDGIDIDTLSFLLVIYDLSYNFQYYNIYM